MIKDKIKIGFTLDYEENGGYSKFPYYAIRQNYLTSVSDLGAIPLALPHNVEFVESYIDMIDGLVITGGAFDVPPQMYGNKDIHQTVSLKPGRTEFEYAITLAAIKHKKPILGICGGQQLLNVILGGTLIQHIPDSIANPLAHEQPNPRNQPGHDVQIVGNSLLANIVGEAKIAVNSAHHQAVDKVGQGVIVNATAPDGVIEGIEYPNHPFCLGVQWHPEYNVSGADAKIFAAFVAACRKTNND